MLIVGGKRVHRILVMKISDEESNVLIHNL